MSTFNEDLKAIMNKTVFQENNYLMACTSYIQRLLIGLTEKTVPHNKR